jgi:hypothetical protein
MTSARSTQQRDTYVTTASAAVSPPAGESGATAIVAWHGMGQQLPYATLAEVAEALAQCHARVAGGAVPTVTARDVDLGGERLRRAELTLAGPTGTREVHVYEAYWAPLTEGKITLPETMQFLLGAGVQGVRYGFWPPRVLERFLFGRWVTFPLSPILALVYLVLLATVLSLIVVNAAVVGISVLKLVTDPGDAHRWPDYALLRDLTLDLAVLAAPFLVLGVTLFLSYRSATREGRHSSPMRKRPIVAALIWFLIALTIAVTLGVGVLIAYHVVAHGVLAGTTWPWSGVFPGFFDHAPALREHPRLALFGAILVWAIVVAGSAGVRWFLLEFVGDTAIYVTSHVLNRFSETRDAVKARSCAVTGAIYTHGGYETHLLMAHSLGSVIAYDTLNRLIADDQVNGGRVQVAARTRLLLTFGSILDKTAFLFRAQADHGEVREALASASQPLISDPRARPRWINIFSPSDVFSGALDYYDPVNGQSGSGRSLHTPPPPITNVADPDAWLPLIAHVQYWTNRLLIETVYAAIP